MSSALEHSVQRGQQCPLVLAENFVGQFFLVLFQKVAHGLDHECLGVGPALGLEYGQKTAKDPGDHQEGDHDGKVDLEPEGMGQSHARSRDSGGLRADGAVAGGLANDFMVGWFCGERPCRPPPSGSQPAFSGRRFRQKVMFPVTPS